MRLSTDSDGAGVAETEHNETSEVSAMFSIDLLVWLAIVATATVARHLVSGWPEQADYDGEVTAYEPAVAARGQRVAKSCL